MQRVIFIFLLFFLMGSGTTSQRVEAAGQDSIEINSIQINPIEVGVDGNRDQEETGSLPDLTQQVDLTEVRGFLEQIDRDVQQALPNFSLSHMFDDLRQGKISLNPVDIGNSLLVLLGKEIVVSAPLIAKLLILAVLTAVLQQLQSAFNGGVGKMAQALAFLMLMGIALATFQMAMDVAYTAIQNMTGFMQTLLPVMMTMLAAMGNLTTAALFKPIVLGSLAFLATLIKTVALPLFFMAAVLKLFNHISSEFKLSKLAGLLEFAGKLSLGLFLTVFIGVMTVQGVTGGVADGVVLRTAKYSADLIPVVGKFFKDAVELVVTSGLLLKNALGIVAIIALALICLGPVVKLVAMILVFKISSALIEPLGQTELADTLQEMSKSLIFIFASVASVAIMFFMAIVVVVGSGNLTIMLR
ncbi:stage III sporulation protein AE [Desulfitobacterium dichloroeliminans]|uniref:stage III sporulation protein AE n=1 Tax=Desulfitobacterium dichloroeliminans TaxID=233055 RepID=UPI000A003139|nr:stage III sporulation protein AE [Desulfitobacterium dichloroeliminans]